MPLPAAAGTPQQPNFEAAYAQYVQDEQQAGRQPVPMPQFVQQLMAVLQQAQAQGQVVPPQAAPPAAAPMPQGLMPAPRGLMG